MRIGKIGKEVVDLEFKQVFWFTAGVLFILEIIRSVVYLMIGL